MAHRDVASSAASVRRPGPSHGGHAELVNGQAELARGPQQLPLFLVKVAAGPEAAAREQVSSARGKPEERGGRGAKEGAGRGNVPPQQTPEHNAPEAVQVLQHHAVHLGAPAGHIRQCHVPAPVPLLDHAARLVHGLLQRVPLGPEDADD